MRKVGILLACTVVASVPLAHRALASTVTLSGTDFTVTYDPTLIDPLFGPLSVSGDNIYFTPNQYKAQSLNGSGLVTAYGTANGITITPNAGYSFSSLALTEFGDYLLLGNSANYVSVSGEMIAFDPSNLTGTHTVANITGAAGYPLNVFSSPANPQTQQWSSTATITDSTVPTNALGQPIGPAWLASATSINLTVQDLLTAYTAGGTGPQEAFIEKKVAGVGITVDTSPVPLPPSVLMMLSGVAGIGMMRRLSIRRGSAA